MTDVEPRFKDRLAKSSKKDVVAERRKFSQAVKRRAGGICEGCPRLIAALGDRAPRPDVVHRGTEAHHILKPRRGGTHDPDNGVWLCKPAHDWAEAYPIEAERLGLSRPSGPINHREIAS